MKLKQFFTDDDAVSPVIGVILMVAITVILAAVIASFVLGLGDSTSTTPNASFDFDQEGAAGDSGAEVTIIHNGGDTLEGDRRSLKGDVGSLPSISSGEYTAGEEIATVDISSASDGDEIRLIYEASGGDSTSTLETYEIQ